MATRKGTSHFASMADAVRYYRAYGYDRSAVEEKIRRGEIHIGKPSTAGAVSIDEDGRYHVEMGK